MRLGGLNPFSLTDFPGRVSAVVFTQGCNFRCRFCHNGTLIPAKPPDGHQVPVQVFFQFLRERQGLLDGVVVSGGEPTLQPDLANFLAKIQALGFYVKLDTNGSHPEVLKPLLQARLVNYVAMDLKAPPEKLEFLIGVKIPNQRLDQSMRLIAHSGLAHEFRTTLVKSLLSDADIVTLKARTPAGSPHYLQEFNARHALDPKLRLVPDTTSMPVSIWRIS